MKESIAKLSADFKRSLDDAHAKDPDFRYFYAVLDNSTKLADVGGNIPKQAAATIISAWAQAGEIPKTP